MQIKFDTNGEKNVHVCEWSGREDEAARRSKEKRSENIFGMFEKSCCCVAIGIFFVVAQVETKKSA